MEMENEDKRPEVWVARRLMRKGCGCDVFPIAYFVSKARVQNVTRRFLRSGKEFSEYEVDLETPEQLEDLNFNGDTGVFVETGEWVKVDRVFKNYITATNYISLLNEKLKARTLNRVPSSMLEETRVSVENDISYARKLEKYFGGFFLGDNRQL